MGDFYGIKSTLSMHRSKVKPRYDSCYDSSWGSSLLFKARMGPLEVNARTYRFNGGKICVNGVKVEKMKLLLI